MTIVKGKVFSSLFEENMYLAKPLQYRGVSINSGSNHHISVPPNMHLINNEVHSNVQRMNKNEDYNPLNLKNLSTIT